MLKASKMPSKRTKKVNTAATHALTDLGFSLKVISEKLGIGINTAMRYRRKELDPEWRLFSEDIKKIYLEQDFELAQLAVKHIKEKIGKASFFSLVGLLKTVREFQMPREGAAVQVNINPQEAKRDVSEVLEGVLTDELPPASNSTPARTPSEDH